MPVQLISNKNRLHSSRRPNNLLHSVIGRAPQSVHISSEHIYVPTTQSTMLNTFYIIIINHYFLTMGCVQAAYGNFDASFLSTI